MLGMLPDIQNMPAINAALAIPLQPGRPAGTSGRGPAVVSQNQPPKPPAPTAAKPVLTVPPTLLPPASAQPNPQTRRETSVQPTGARVVPAIATASVAGR
jgi:cell division protein FtsI (penicillin-binding protein 3)